MSMKPERMQFNGGELSPWLGGRTDIAKYDKTARLCRNFIPLAEGCLKRRGGTKFIAYTPTVEKLAVMVTTNPRYARVRLNGIETRKIYVCDHDEVEIFAEAEGFLPYHETVVITPESRTREIVLTAVVPTVRLEIVRGDPQWSEVYLNGVACTDTIAPLNSTVKLTMKYEYQNIFCFNLYEDIVLDKSKTLTRGLSEIHDVYEGFGAWGESVGFNGCTPIMLNGKAMKCYCVQFTNGVVTAVFDEHIPKVPSEVMFHPEFAEANTLLELNGQTVLAKLKKHNGMLEWCDKDGKTLQIYDTELCKFMHWPSDENGEPIARYTQFDGQKGHGSFYIYERGKPMIIWKGKK